MALTEFSLLYDYRCPFARNVHQHVLTALGAGMDLAVTFEPYTLSQGHISEGDQDVWDNPAHDGTLIALEASVAVRDEFPEHFSSVHGAFFEARHAQGIPLSDRTQVGSILDTCGLDPEAVFSVVDTGGPRFHIADRWRHYNGDLDVFGVPTFVISDEDAVFVRVMTGPDATDPSASIALVRRILDLIDENPEINEFKHTRLSR
ncbi:MAG: DsbA family protein [Actinomycetes bacterium]